MTQPNLVDLLKQTEKWLLQEFADDQEMVVALGKGDSGKAQALLVATQKDEAVLVQVHAALLGAVTAWKTDFNAQLEAAPLDQKFILLEQEKPVTDHLAQIEAVFEQVHSGFRVLSITQTVSHDTLRSTLDALTRWRDGAHAVAREIGALETFEEHLRAKLEDRTKYEMPITDFVINTSKELGEGASAFVYRAVHKSTGKDYVLKYYKDLVSFDAERDKGLLSQAIERLIRVAHFNHPNLISCKGFCLEKDAKGKLQLIAVLPFVQGTKLTRYLEQKQWTEADVRRFYDAVGPAVQYMIDNGVVHSDLAPRNIMVAGTSGNESYFLIDFENIQLLAKDVSRTNASADYFYSPIEVLLGRLQGETNTTIPFFALGKIGIRMTVGSESAFEELHSRQSTNDYLFPTLVAKVLEKRCTPQFIQAVVMATLPEIKDRFSSWKLMRSALEKGIVGTSLPRRLLAATKAILTTPIAHPFANAAAILRGDRVIQKAPEYAIVTDEDRVRREREKQEKEDAKRRVKEEKEAEKKRLQAEEERRRLGPGALPATSWLVPVNSFEAASSGSTRFDAADQRVRDEGKRLLYPQEMFAILARGLYQADFLYVDAAGDMRQKYEWTNLALRRVLGGFELWYDPKIVWNGSQYVPAVEPSRVVRVDGSASRGFVNIKSLPVGLQKLWDAGPGVFDIAVAKTGGLWLPAADDARWWPVGRGDDGGFGLCAGYGDGASRGCVLAQKKFSSGNEPLESDFVTCSLPDVEGLEVEAKKVDEYVRYDVSLNRLQSLGMRHLHPREIFTILCDAQEGSPEHTIKVNMLQGKGEWTTVAWKREGDALLVWEGPVLAWNSSTSQYDGEPPAGANVAQFSVAGIKSRTWIAIARFNYAFVTYHYGREANSVPKSPNLWLPSPGSWWPVGRGYYGLDFYLCAAYDWASRGCLGSAKKNSP